MNNALYINQQKSKHLFKSRDNGRSQAKAPSRPYEFQVKFLFPCVFVSRLTTKIWSLSSRMKRSKKAVAASKKAKRPRKTKAKSWLYILIYCPWHRPFLLIKIIFSWEEREAHLAAQGWTYVRTPSLKCSIKHVDTALPINIWRHADERQLLNHLWTDEIWTHITKTTTLLQPAEAAASITVSDIYKYFGMVCIFSTYGCPNLSLYFRTGEGEIHYPG